MTMYDSDLSEERRRILNLMSKLSESEMMQMSEVIDLVCERPDAADIIDDLVDRGLSHPFHLQTVIDELRKPRALRDAS